MTQRDDGHDYRDSKNKAQAYEREKKYPAIIDMVIQWLNSNIDEWEDEKFAFSKYKEVRTIVEKNYLALDSKDLKEKIEIALNPSTTKRQIENGDL